MKKIPHVMHVIDSLAIGGAERILVDLVNSINTEKYKVSVCVTRYDGKLSKEINPAIPIKVLNRKWNFDPKGFLGIKTFSSEQHPDIYHVHSRTTYSFLLTSRALGFINKPILLHDHFGDIDLNPSVPFWFSKYGAKRLSHYIGVSSKLRDWGIKAGIPKNKISIMENSIDIDRYNKYSAIDLRKELNIPKERKIGIFVGNLRLAKGLDLLIDACLTLPSDIIPVFVIVGKELDITYVNSCKEKIKRAGIENHFRFVGPQENSLAWMKGADFAVLPSRSESGPLVLIEYLASGLPFIAFRVGEISDTLFHHFPESFVKLNDISTFGKGIARVTTRVDFEQQRNKGKELSYRLFDIKNRLPILYEVYQNVLQETK